MPNAFRLAPDDLDRLARELDTAHAHEYQQALSGLHQVNRALGAAWNGSASAAFQNAHGEWIGHLERIGRDLPAIAVYLRAAADEYRKLDLARRTAVFKTEFDQLGAGGGQPVDERRARGGTAWADTPTHQGDGPAVPAVKNGRLPVFTAQQAQDVFDWVQGYAWDPSNPNGRFSWAFTPDGCYARAEVMNHLIQERYGLEPWKVWAFDASGALNPAGTYGGVDFRWGYHVAPLITVRNADGSETPNVIDPSIADKPVTVQEWARLMQAQSDVNVDFTSPGVPPTTGLDGPAPTSNYTPTSGVPILYKDGVLVAYSEELMENFNQCVASGEAFPPFDFSTGSPIIVPYDPDTCGYPRLPRPGR